MTMSSLLSLQIFREIDDVWPFFREIDDVWRFFRDFEHGACVFQKLSMLAARLGKWSRKIQSCSFPVEKFVVVFLNKMSVDFSLFSSSVSRHR